MAISLKCNCSSSSGSVSKRQWYLVFDHLDRSSAVLRPYFLACCPNDLSSGFTTSHTLRCHFLSRNGLEVIHIASAQYQTTTLMPRSYCTSSLKLLYQFSASQKLQKEHSRAQGKQPSRNPWTAGWVSGSFDVCRSKVSQLLPCVAGLTSAAQQRLKWLFLCCFGRCGRTFSQCRHETSRPYSTIL